MTVENTLLVDETRDAGPGGAWKALAEYQPGTGERLSGGGIESSLGDQALKGSGVELKKHHFTPLEKGVLALERSIALGPEGHVVATEEVSVNALTIVKDIIALLKEEDRLLFVKSYKKHGELIAIAGLLQQWSGSLEGVIGYLQETGMESSVAPKYVCELARDYAAFLREKAELGNTPPPVEHNKFDSIINS